MKNIFFKKWKYLIKAPIWSGKSFLFFDGPVYALYKYNTRNILNTDSKNWFIKLLFEQDDQKYLIIRNLEQWKTKDTCKSQLFLVEWNLGNYDESKDIQESLVENKANLNEIIFKNETDLDWSLKDLLPPKEVFLSTVFLLQDSSNIFELQPADRLTVMKSIFNLVWIDDIKDKIADRKKEIQTTIKVKSDTTLFDNKIKISLGNYIDSFLKIDDSNFIKIPNENKEFIKELKLISDKLKINDFSMEWFNFDLSDIINDKINKWKQEYQWYLASLQNTEKSINEQKNKINNFNNEKMIAERKIIEIESKISWFDPDKINNKKQKKLEIISQMETLQKSIDYNIEIPKNIQFWSQWKIIDLEWMNELINKITIEWKLLADQKKVKESQIETQKIKRESQIKNFEIEIKNLESNKNELQSQLEKIGQSIFNMESTINKESQFACAKIESNCPFVKEINKWTFEELERQLDNLNKEKIEIQGKIWDIDLKIQEIENWKNQFNLWWNNILDLEKEIWKIDEEILVLRSILAKIDFKKVQELWQNWKILNNENQILDKEILELESWAKDLENLKTEKIRLTQQIENIEANKLIAGQEISKLSEVQNEQKWQLDNFNVWKYDEIERLNKNMERSLHEIQVLVDDFKENSIIINRLKQDETMVKNLYQIFSKELLLFVLEWYLPVLTEIINVLLAQIVDYTIDIKLKQKWDNLEMDVRIFDDKWERDIKSLSGWQKVILKLVWMLAISNYIRSPMLFMDETINNLDQDTVWKVADMLENFVKQRDLKLYTVTHSQQIQDMDIWDDVIEIKN